MVLSVRMSATFRNSRPSRSYLFRDDEQVAAVPMLAPDITTSPERPRTLTGAQSAIPVAPASRAVPAKSADSTLESRHPEIVRAISLLWGFPEMNDYFDRIWLADGSHGPIDPDAMSDLMFLARVHQMIVPQRPGRSLASIYGSNRLYDPSSTGHDPWSDVPPRR